MKILQIINSLFTAGAEKLLFDTIPMYNQIEDIQMDLLVLWDGDEYPFLKQLQESEQVKNIIILNHSSRKEDIYNIRNILKLRKYIKNYDILHVHLFPAQYFVALANMGMGKKMIFTEHNTSNTRINNKVYKPLEKWCYQQYDQLVCISEEILNIYNNYLNLYNKTKLIQNGVDLKMIQNASCYSKNKIQSNIKEDDILLIQISAFRIQKDQDSLVRAMNLLPPHYKLALVGIGEREEEVKNLVLQLNLTDRVHFLGQRMDVPSLLKTVDIVVLSSKYEGLSLSSIEAMASGKPFIASNVPGLKDVVSGAGVLFELGDVKGLANSIIKLMEEKSYYDAVVESCLARAKEYDIQIMVDKHVELYRSLMK